MEKPMAATRKKGLPEGSEMLILAGALFVLTVALIALMKVLA
jgi:hypothetical protein